jgi:hypothetical protein
MTPAECGAITRALLAIVEWVEADRPRDWHLYPTRLRDLAIIALTRAGVEVKPYYDCMEREP